jgi:putative peptide zinc metalloprotease protein
VAFALASQLVITLDGPLSDASLAELEDLWAEIAEFAANIEDVPLSELQARLTAYRERIEEIVQADPAASTPGATPGPTDTPTPTPTGTVEPGVPAEPAPGDQTPAPPAPEPTTTPSSPEPTPEPTGTPVP